MPLNAAQRTKLTSMLNMQQRGVKVRTELAKAVYNDQEMTLDALRDLAYGVMVDINGRVYKRSPSAKALEMMLKLMADPDRQAGGLLSLTKAVASRNEQELGLPDSKANLQNQSAAFLGEQAKVFKLSQITEDHLRASLQSLGMFALNELIKIPHEAMQKICESEAEYQKYQVGIAQRMSEYISGVLEDVGIEPEEDDEEAVA